MVLLLPEDKKTVRNVGLRKQLHLNKILNGVPTYISRVITLCASIIAPIHADSCFVVILMIAMAMK